ncbi:MAG: hypothetical protein WCE53_14325 [Candidatus Acidiferrum sp.]
MPKNLKRVMGRGDLHFITLCCYQQRALQGTVRNNGRTIRFLSGLRRF